MRENTSNNKSGGIGFGGLRTIIFITLKLCRVIDWSWWWVLSPILIVYSVGLAFTEAVRQAGELESPILIVYSIGLAAFGVGIIILLLAVVLKIDAEKRIKKWKGTMK